MTEYLHADGDGVGDRLELLLLDGNTAEAATFSAAITHGILSVAQKLRDEGWTICFCGGDEVFAWAEHPIDLDALAGIRGRFFQQVGCTLSVGLGCTPAIALSCLRRAKLKGRNRIEWQGKK